MSQETDVNDVSGEDHRSLTKDEALLELGRIVGFRGFSRTQLRKEDMNSLYWYLTGETLSDWRDFGTTESPDFIRMRKALADEAGFPYMDSWTDSRPFRRNELRALVYALRHSDDHRQHADDT